MTVECDLRIELKLSQYQHELKQLRIPASELLLNLDKSLEHAATLVWQVQRQSKYFVRLRICSVYYQMGQG